MPTLITLEALAYSPPRSSNVGIPEAVGSCCRFLLHDLPFSGNRNPTRSTRHSGLNQGQDTRSNHQPPTYNPPPNFCAYFNCIASFWGADDPGDGYVVECADGTYSQSGGERGACSSHGGIQQPLYSH